MKFEVNILLLASCVARYQRRGGNRTSGINKHVDPKVLSLVHGGLVFLDVGVAVIDQKPTTQGEPWWQIALLNIFSAFALADAFAPTR